MDACVVTFIEDVVLDCPWPILLAIMGDEDNYTTTHRYMLPHRQSNGEMIAAFDGI